jgi:hypothetical protein
MITDGETSMVKITPGSIVIGKSGKRLIVDAIEGDTIYSGGLKILASAVVKVIPPVTRFKLGDRVKYIGSNRNLKTQYAGVLEVWEMGKLCDLDKCACLKPNGRVTSWIEFADLQLVDELEVAQ